MSHVLAAEGYPQPQSDTFAMSSAFLQGLDLANALALHEVAKNPHFDAVLCIRIDELRDALTTLLLPGDESDPIQIAAFFNSYRRLRMELTFLSDLRSDLRYILTALTPGDPR